jgi:hypothetical protein
MNKLTTATLLFTAGMLTSCDDIGRAMSPTEIVEANGETYVIDQSAGKVFVVNGSELRPLEVTSTTVFTMEKDTPLGKAVIDFEFLIAGSQVYWSGRITPNLAAETFETDEEAEVFMGLWRRNITQSGNFINFKIEPLSSSIGFGELRINMSEVNTRTRNAEGEITQFSGNGVKTVNLDYELIESQGGTAFLWISPSYVLDITD